ncbi:type II toxin-antitoxin system HipA family toxin YjjJ [Luteimonas terricola]|uniref:Transcriptional regulator n=1 Tax=Luteimonas terricola TaxID=645597 RepID=A0ABQ2ELY2_9GAMM|nr:type II toxin-antitoxin system HipA family toxin YjjJ [Luteimonas terricola]GGK16469.1 transcriptional regulator [Luteimonas terricola]
MDDSRLTQALALLRRDGPLPARDIGRQLGISQPTVSRLLASAGDRVVRIGRARSTRYAAARDIGRAGRCWPLYRIGPDARPTLLGELRALAGDAFHFAASRPAPAFVHADFAPGLFPALPWFLDDQRPQGFLGRAFVHRIAGDIGAPDDLLRWRSDDVLLALLRHGHDQPGDLVLGEAALQAALQAALSDEGTLAPEARATHYPLLADAALRGEAPGSSAAGEQPKFLANLREDGGVRSLVVKFSERSDTPAGRRWADLLHCERIAADVLHDHGHAAARTDVLEAGGRVFLESTRFDRTPVRGRHGFVSLAAIDAAFHGHARIDWWRYADELQRDGWLDAADAHRLRVLGWFGALIGNSDMHLGNAGLVLADDRPLALAPAYDMLPMMFRPATSGEVVAREFSAIAPLPEQLDAWREAAHAAQAFWSRVVDSRSVSAPFRAIAGHAGESVTRVGARYAA